MKRGASLRQKTPMKPGKGFAPRSAPMARGSSTLARAGTLKQGGPLARSTGLKSSVKPMAAVGQRAKRMRQGKVASNAEEQAWLDAVAGFGCIVCYLFHHAKTPCAVHHPTAGGRRMGHLFAIGLCDPGHHQNSPTPEKISRHPHKKRFEEAYGTEAELLAAQRALLGWPPP